MKIAVIAKTRLPIAEPFRGGLEAFTYTVCEEYMRKGHDVTLYAHADSTDRFNLRSFYGDAYRNDKNFILYESNEYHSIIDDIEQGDYDVVHNNATHELPILWGAQATIPVVTTLHTPSLSRFKAAIIAASASNNLHFVSVSKSLADTWQPFLQHGSTVIYNGINLQAWPLTRVASNYLFWYGRMVHAKGLDIALDAAHRVGLPLHFAGSLDDSDYYDNEIKPRLKSDDVYLGHLSQADIVPAMSGAAAMINAARWEEPFGLSNIEAMAAGVPVAGFDRGAFREIVTPESGVIANGMHVEALAEAIEQAATLSSHNARARAEQFSIEAMTENYLNFFKEII